MHGAFVQVDRDCGSLPNLLEDGQDHLPVTYAAIVWQGVQDKVAPKDATDVPPSQPQAAEV